MVEFSNAVSSIPWFAWVAIVAVVCGCVSDLVKRRYRHLERLEMIRQGINPDSNKSAGPPDC